MTQVLAVRLDQRQLARLNSVARKRSLTRSAVVRQALDKYFESVPTQKGVGWAEHFERLFREGRRIKGHPDDEIRALNR